MIVFEDGEYLFKGYPKFSYGSTSICKTTNVNNIRIFRDYKKALFIMNAINGMCYSVKCEIKNK